MTEVHVIRDERTWRVYDTAAPIPVSEHTTATDAELAAKARAEDRDAQRVVIHNRYHRTHDAARSPGGGRRGVGVGVGRARLGGGLAGGGGGEGGGVFLLVEPGDGGLSGGPAGMGGRGDSLWVAP